MADSYAYELKELIDVQTNSNTGGGEFFTNATNFTIGHQVNNNIQHTNITVNHIGESKEDIQTLLNPIPDASHLRNLARSPPNAVCLPNTRTHVLKCIKSWVGSSPFLPSSSSNSILLPSSSTKRDQTFPLPIQTSGTKTLPDDPTSTRILWLHGYVGCGKSAIAQSISSLFHTKHRLLGSFFFLRGSRDRSSAARFACTMASQLIDSTAVPSARPYVETAARKTGMLNESAMPVQFEQLFLEPWRAAVRKPGRAMAQQMVKGPFLAVVDGLDECEDTEEVRGLLSRLLLFFKQNPKAPLRFLISSRAEDHIRSPLEDEEVRSLVHLLDLSANTTDEDLACVVDETFKEAARASRVIRSYGAQWPSAEQRAQLVKHAGGSLIAISTLLKFIIGGDASGGSDSDGNSKNTTPNHRLQLALDMEVGLDELYAEILSRAKDLPGFHDIVSTIVLVQSPLSIARLAKLLGRDKGEVTTVLVNLYAIVHVPEGNLTPVTLFHSSLREFLTAEGRSKAFFVPPTQHKFLAYRYFEHIGAPGSTESHSGKDLYLKNLAPHHWGNYIALHRGDPTQLRQDLRDLLSHILTTYPQFSDFTTSFTAFYTLLDRHWLTSIAGKSQTSTIGEFLEFFVGAKHAVPAPRFVQRVTDAIDSVVVLLSTRDSPEPQGEVALKAFWEDKTPPLTDLPPLLPYHTPLLEMCIHYLFARREAPTQMPLAFVPEYTSPSTASQQRNIDASGYAFWAFGRHLALAIQHDPGFDFTRAVSVSRRRHPDSSGWKGETWPFHFMDLQRRIRNGVNPEEHIKLFKANFEMGSSIIGQVLRANSIHPSAFESRWRFSSKPKPQGGGNYWVYGCDQESFSILDIWTGYSMIGRCFIASTEGLHDENACPLHRLYNQAKTQGTSN